MATRKFTIELSEETIAVIERLKLDEVTIEEAIPRFVDMGIVDAITSGESTNPLARLMDRIMSSFTGSNKGKVDDDLAPSTTIKMMRINENGQPVEMDMNDLPPEVAEHLKGMTASITQGISEGKSIEEIMESVGATKCVHADDIPAGMKESASKVNTGNLIHFPDTSKLS
jgi:urease gamma subunit